MQGIERSNAKAGNGYVKNQQVIDDLGFVMGDEKGRRFVWRLLGNAGIFQSSYVPGDPTQTVFNEGMRNQGLMLMHEITTQYPDLFLKMQKEATQP